jgi:hypothetical protein
VALRFSTANAADGQALADLRVDAMRESLERIGRFDPVRARERFLRLRGSESNRFYMRHGFVQVEQGEFDNHYVRLSQNAP